MILTCPVCKTQFDGKGAKKYCSKKCYQKARLLREYPLAPKKCPVCGDEFTPKNRKDQKHCSIKCFNAARTLASNPKHVHVCPVCGEGFMPEKSNRQVYCSKRCLGTKSHDANRFSGNRHLVLKRDKHKCVVCGATTQLSVHHKDRSGQEYRPNNSMDNLVVLCGSCHKSEHSETFDARRTRTETACQQCGGAFEVTPSKVAKGKGKYCSKECYNKSMENSVEITCQTCGKVFKVWPTRLRDGRKVKYCSIECQAKGAITRQKVNCAYCGKEFEAVQSDLAKGKGKYCSPECQHQGARNRIKTPCQVCGTEFEFCPSRLKRGPVKYCSTECLRIGRLSKHP